jgi:hypothetical protein
LQLISPSENALLLASAGNAGLTRITLGSAFASAPFDLRRPEHFWKPS